MIDDSKRMCKDITEHGVVLPDPRISREEGGHLIIMGNSQTETFQLLFRLNNKKYPN